MASRSIELDPNLLPWAIIPILVITCSVSYGRLLINILLKKDSSKVDDKDLVHKQTLMRALRMRQNGGILTRAAIEKRKKFFIGEEGVLQTKNLPEADPMEAMSKAMENMSMGGMMAMMATQIAMYSFVTWMFPGFVLLKLPFPITEKFRPLLQNGLSVSTLDITYVTSLSWYFLTMFGTQPFVQLLASRLSQTDMAEVMLQQQMGMAMNQRQAQAFDAKKKLDAEAKMFTQFMTYATNMPQAKAASEKLAGITSKKN